MRPKAPEAARTLSRRFNARDAYRRRRDKKISVDWIGCGFGVPTIIHKPVSVRLTDYDPRAHTIRFMDPWGVSFNLETDVFWRLLRSGDIVKE